MKNTLKLSIFFLAASTFLSCSKSKSGPSRHSFSGSCGFDKGLCLNLYSNDVDGETLPAFCNSASQDLKDSGIPKVVQAQLNKITTEEACSNTGVSHNCTINGEAGELIELKFYNSNYSPEEAQQFCSEIFQ
ncbi:MAG: hypothetical protein R3A80_09260 [Bdellovibrionota bacterium]